MGLTRMRSASHTEPAIMIRSADSERNTETIGSAVESAPPLSGGERVFDRDLRPLLLVLFLFLIVLIVRSAWLSEDSYIGWRVVDNFVHGHGLRWNVLDRVQVYTDPLFILLVSGFYAVTHEIFITATLLCIMLSVLAVYLVLSRVSVSFAAALAGVAALLSSRAFIDFSTSGLENPLSFLLVAGFYVVYFRRRIFDLRTTVILTLLLALLGLNRLDLCLLLAPAVLLALYEQVFVQRTPPVRLIGCLILASSPLWLWLLFSTVYYGFPFPNTYYAKLHTGIGAKDLMFQGILYYLNELNSDSVTLVTIACAFCLALARRELKAWAAAFGIFLYLIYILKIGGDFMAGRFFSVPFFAAVTLLLRSPLPAKSFLTMAVAFIGIGLLVQRPTLFNDEHYFANAGKRDVIDHRGVADERGFIFQSSGLLPVLKRLQLEPLASWAKWGQRERQKGAPFSIFGNIGFYGFYVGPKQYILDTFGLGDPLLSRLPIARQITKAWRIGHFKREIPAGYPETIQSGRNQIKDPAIAKLYDVIKVITQDPIWSWRRFKEIFLINIGYYNNLMKRPKLETPGASG